MVAEGTIFTINSIVVFKTTLISSCCYFCPADRTANVAAAAAVLVFKMPVFEMLLFKMLVFKILVFEMPVMAMGRRRRG